MTQKYKAYIPIDIVHGIQEDVGLVPMVKDDAMNRHVPNLVIVVEVVDVTPPCREAMVALLHIKHLASKYGKVGSTASLASKWSLADYQRLLYKLEMSLETSSDLALSLYIEMYNTRSPSL